MNASLVVEHLFFLIVRSFYYDTMFLLIKANPGLEWVNIVLCCSREVKKARSTRPEEVRE